MKYLMNLILVLGISHFSYSQATIKIKGAAVVSHLSRPPSNSSGAQVPKIGFQTGAAFMFSHKKISLQAELLYTLKGLRDTTYIYSVVPTGNGYPYYRGYGYNFHYIELPIILRLPFVDGVNLGIGPSVAYLLHSDKILDGRKMPRRRNKSLKN